jgi:type II secretory pathway pseudopilin PulG
MNRFRPHHKIYGVSLSQRSSLSVCASAAFGRREDGYALVALMALMTLMALFALAAAPSIRQQVQREQEKDAIYRGEQVADAIRDFYIYRRAMTNNPGPQALPSSMDQLLEGVQIPGRTKKLQILRVSASRDPLDASGEWGYVAPQSQKLIAFQRDVAIYAGSMVPTPKNPQVVELQRLAVPQMTGIIDIGSSESSSAGDGEADDISGPFVGVASRSKRNSILHYYGIQKHNQWIFTPLFR